MTIISFPTDGNIDLIQCQVPEKMNNFLITIIPYNSFYNLIKFHSPFYLINIIYIYRETYYANKLNQIFFVQILFKTDPLISSNFFSFPRFFNFSLTGNIDFPWKIFIHSRQNSLQTFALFWNEINPRNRTTRADVQIPRFLFLKPRESWPFSVACILSREGGEVYRPSEKFRNRSGRADTRKEIVPSVKTPGVKEQKRGVQMKGPRAKWSKAGGTLIGHASSWCRANWLANNETRKNTCFFVRVLTATRREKLVRSTQYRYLSLSSLFPRFSTGTRGTKSDDRVNKDV